MGASNFKIQQPKKLSLQTLFFTHIMQEVEAICDCVIIIKNGELLLDKSLKELQESHQQTIYVTFDAENQT